MSKEIYQKRGDELVQLAAPGISADVPLSDAVDVDSSVTAASSKAVKTAYDKAVEACNVPLLSDAVDSGSSVTGASSKAVKAAWDKAMEACGAIEDSVSVKYFKEVRIEDTDTLTINYDSPNFICHFFTGARTIKITKKAPWAAVKYLYLWGSGTATISGVDHWGTADNKAPTYDGRGMVLQIVSMWGENIVNVIWSRS